MFFLNEFQYGGFTILSEGGSSNEDPHVRLHLGLTDYRSFSILVTFIYSVILQDLMDIGILIIEIYLDF